jgi:thymidylate synthase (FAD)
MKERNHVADTILDRYYAVHDHGFISLVDYMGGDEAIDRAARNSIGLHMEGRTEEERAGLINRLMRDEHTSPFEMCELKFHCAMPIFVARQWIRHRTANVNEFSGRYSKMPCKFYSPRDENVSLQNASNKQGRGETADHHTTDQFLSNLDLQRDMVEQNYEWAIDSGISRELARIDLPLSTYTQWYWKIDLHNLFHFLKLRLNPAAQLEIRAYAQIMAAMTRIVAPQSFAAWENYELNSVKVPFDLASASTWVDCNIPVPSPIVIPSLDLFSIRNTVDIIDDWT